MDYNNQSLRMHEDNKGKIEVISKVKITSREDLSTAYTPGVAEPCRKIHENSDEVYKYTSKGNIIAVVSDGTAVLGLGDIGPEASIPVMEGKAILFKEFAGVDAFPICLRTKDVEEIVNTVKLLEPVFGGINLEDISAPRCFEIEKRLKEELNIPVFHDDQHGTAIVVLAGLINSLKLVNKSLEEAKIVINGAGSAGISICKLLLLAGSKNIIMCDRAGILVTGSEWMNSAQEEIARMTNHSKLDGDLSLAINGADVFIGVSGPNALDSNMVSTMNKDAIIFAMANPTPEIMPQDAKKGGARIVATGRSDFPNQINNVLVFPGIFKGALSVRASDITEEMKLAAANAIAKMVTVEELSDEYIIPSALDKRVAEKVASEVAKVAKEQGIAKI
ncbi:malate dehydrogenase [Clostridium sediminicola]|uniref:NAD(P)-dependent malic enzyme n=1 Tax=Clostridium sediminicola TaxID=3114879 RepID=UPI0031F1E1E0